VIHLSKPASVLLHVDCVSVVMIINIDKHTAGQNIMHELITVGTYTCKIYTNSVVVVKIIFAIIRNSVPVFISLFLLLLFNFCGLLVNIVTLISTEVSQDTRN